MPWKLASRSYRNCDSCFCSWHCFSRLYVSSQHDSCCWYTQWKQWLLQYQDRAIFKWVKYQKLRHFLEPYHAPYNGKYCYWTGLLLFVRAFLYLISLLNFSWSTCRSHVSDYNRWWVIYNTSKGSHCKEGLQEFLILWKLLYIST